MTAEQLEELLSTVGDILERASGSMTQADFDTFVAVLVWRFSKRMGFAL